MLKVLFSFVLTMWTVLAFGQALRVSFPQSTIYVGEPFTMDVSLSGGQLAQAEATFTPAIETAVRGHRIQNINGNISSSVTLMGIAPEVGAYTLTSVKGLTEEGEEVTSTLNHTFHVRRIEPDAAVTWTTELVQKELYPGDTYELIYTLKVPALKVNGKRVPPFINIDFFGRMQPVAPRVSISLEEDKILDQRTETHFEGDFCLYQFIFTLMAEKSGTITVAPPVMPRQNRAVDINGNGQLEVVDSYSLGESFTFEIKSAPEEGRPLSWTGAIAHDFHVVAHLDALEATVGDPLKLTIAIITDAATDSMLSLPLPAIEGFRVMEKPERERHEQGLLFHYALRPLKEGLLEVPALPLSWYSRDEHRYQTALTPVIPLQVHASPKAFYENAHGDLLTSDFPPSLIFAEGEAPELSMSPKIFWWMVAMMTLAGIRFCHRPFAWALRQLVRPLGWFLPKVRLQMALRSAKTPEAALAAIRKWYRRPSLTGDDIVRNNTSPEAQAVAQAYRQLEAARYASGEEHQWQSAVKTLLKLVPKVRLLLPLVLLFITFTASAKGYAFEREQAVALSTQAQSEEGFELALQRWLSLCSAGDQSAPTLMNSVTTAYFAHQPQCARECLQRYEMLYGRDAKSRQAHRALDALDGHVKTFWASTYERLQTALPYSGWLNLLGITIALFALTFVRRWRSATILQWMRVLRVILFLLLCLLEYQRGTMKRALDRPFSQPLVEAPSSIDPSSSQEDVK